MLRIRLKKTKRRAPMTDQGERVPPVHRVADDRMVAPVEVYRQVVPDLRQPLNPLQNLKYDPHLSPSAR